MIVMPFKLDDLGWFMPNEFSNPDTVLPVLVGRGGWEAHTFWRNEQSVELIAALREYWNGCWEGFFLVSSSFLPENITKLRLQIEDFMASRRVIRLQTESVSHATLRSWHRHLGFELEGVKKKMMFNRDYDCWAIVREV